MNLSDEDLAAAVRSIRELLAASSLMTNGVRDDVLRVLDAAERRIVAANHQLLNHRIHARAEERAAVVAWLEWLGDYTGRAKELAGPVECAVHRLDDVASSARAVPPDVAAVSFSTLLESARAARAKVPHVEAGDQRKTNTDEGRCTFEAHGHRCELVDDHGGSHAVTGPNGRWSPLP